MKKKSYYKTITWFSDSGPDKFSIIILCKIVLTSKLFQVLYFFRSTLKIYIVGGTTTVILFPQRDEGTEIMISVLRANCQQDWDLGLGLFIFLAFPFLPFILLSFIPSCLYAQPINVLAESAPKHYFSDVLVLTSDAGHSKSIMQPKGLYSLN